MKKNFLKFPELSYKKLTLAATLALLALILTTLYGDYKLKQVGESGDWVRHTLEVQANLEELNSLAYEAAYEQRGYLLNPLQLHKDNFSNLLSRIQTSLAGLEASVKDNPQQAANIAKAAGMLKELTDYYEFTIRLADSGEREKAMAFVSAGRGQKALGDIQSLLYEIKEVEEGLLKSRMTSEREARNSVNNTVSAGTVISLVIVLAFILLAYKENHKKEIIQRELNRSAQVQTALLNAAAFALIATDTSGKVTHFNPAAEKLLGRKSEEMIGKDVTLFFLPEEIVELSNRILKEHHERLPLGFDILRFYPDQGIVENTQWTLVNKEGEKIPVKLSMTSLKDEFNRPTGYISVGYDVTEELKIEETLIRAREEALAGTKAKSEFLANMSHEIRTPMNAIMGMAELLAETELTEEQRKYVGIFQNAGQGLLHIINDILDLSKIEAGHFELDSSLFELSSIIKKSAEIMAVKAHQKQLELAVDMEDDIHDHFIGDGNRLGQILINLLGNAVKFTRKGEVVLKVYSGKELNNSKKEVYFEVLDTGVGMKPDQLQGLFKRFLQADSSITKEFGGTGLGLSITKKLVELMDGSVEVQSTLGVGTRFIVKVILEKTESHSPTIFQANLLDKRILIVDDTKTNRLILKKILERAGAFTEEAHSGEIALKMINERKNDGKEPYEMILLDCRMPGLDGFSFAEKLKESEGLSTPLMMMLTSDNRPGDLSRSKGLGFKAHLVKPILRDDLLSSIDNAFRVTEIVENKFNEIPTVHSIEKKLQILLVDDNDENRLVIKAFLKGRDYSIHEAKNGHEAIRFYQNNLYDLILMDMQMPELDGYAATKKIRSMESERLQGYVPIIALTAYALKEEVDKSIEAGCNAHVTKPVSKAQILDIISHHTGSIVTEISKENDDIVPDYLSSREKEILQLVEALRTENFHLLQSIGHKLKGSAGSYGFQKLSDIGELLEINSKSQDKISVAKALAEYQLFMKLLKVSYV